MFAYLSPQIGTDRPMPSVPLTIHGPAGSAHVRAILDTGAEVVVLPRWVGKAIGFEFHSPEKRPEAETEIGIRGVGGALLPTSFQIVELEIKEGAAETYRWQAGVAFLLDTTEEYILGHYGGL